MDYLKKLLFISSIFLICGPIWAQDVPAILKSQQITGSGRVISKTRELENFSTLNIQGAFDIVIYCGKSRESYIEIQADDNIEPLICTKQENQRLNIRVKKEDVDFLNLNPSSIPQITLHVPNLNAIFASGSSKIGLYNIRENLKVDIKGSSTLTVRGQSDDVKIYAYGSSEIYAQELIAKSIAFEIYGASRVKIQAPKKLKGTLAGSSSLDYVGKPTINEVNIFGSAQLNQL